MSVKPPRIVTGEILSRSAPDYHGRFGTGSPKQDWEQAHHTRRLNEIGDPLRHSIQRRIDDQHRSDGRAAVGLLAGTAGVSLGLGEALRAHTNRENKRLRAKLARPRPVPQPVLKAWDKADPYMWHAEHENGAHKITILGEAKRKAESRKPKPAMDRMARLGRATEGPKGAALLAGGVTAASMLTIPRALGPAQENERLHRQMQRRGSVLKADDRGKRQQGAAMTGTGTVLAGTGLLAGGIPGAPEPKKKYMFGHLRGTTAKEMASRQNIRHNLRAGKSFPRAGILGFRASAHENVTDEFKSHLPHKGQGNSSKYYNEPSNNYQRAHLEAKIGEEEKVMHGLRRARKATYGLTLGGAALALAGQRRKRQNSPVLKKDTRSPRDTTAGTALGAGAGLATIGHVVPKGLDRFERKYESRAIGNFEQAHRLAPHFGGVKVNPARYDAWGRPAKKDRKTMEPVKPDWQIRETKAYDRIRGGANGKRAQRVATLRGKASQEKHFAEVFHNTSRAFHQVRTPGLLLAAAGGGGLLSSHKVNKRVPVGAVLLGTAGGGAGALAGLHAGMTAGKAVANHNIAREWTAVHGALPKGMTPVGGNTFVRRKTAVSRGASIGVPLGALLAGRAGYRAARALRAARSAKLAKSFAPMGGFRPDNIMGAKGLVRPNKTLHVMTGSGTSGKAHAWRRYGEGNDKIGGGVIDMHSTGTVQRGTYASAHQGTWARANNKQTRGTYNGDPIGLRQLAGKNTYADVWVGKSDDYETAQMRRANAAGRRGVDAAKKGQSFRAGYHTGRSVRHEMVDIGLESDRNAMDVLSDRFSAKAGRATGGYLLGRHRNKVLASVAAPAVFIAGRKSKKGPVGKSRTYGYTEKRRNPFRTAELGVGIGVGAHGASRLQVGRQVNRGVRIAEAKGHGKQAHTLVAHGRKLRDNTREVTGQAEAGLRRRIPGFGTALDKIPAKMRPKVMVGAGALLAARAIPTHDERFVATGGW